MTPATATEEAALDPRQTGARIEALLDALAGSGPVVAERAEELVHHVSGLYGQGITRILTILDARGALDRATLDALCADALVADLLLLLDLHPDDVATRVARALDSVRPYLGSHGGDVELVAVTPDPGPAGSVTVALRLLGSCDGCPSSAVTLQLAVEDAVRAAAPEVGAIEVTETSGGRGDHAAGVIPVTDLRRRLDAEPPGAGAPPATDWHPLAALDAVGPGEVVALVVEEQALLACRPGDDVLVFLDRCGACLGPLAGAALAEGLLVCPRCGSRFDPRRAGAGVGTDARLTPLPVLLRDGVRVVALPTPAGSS